MPRRFLKLGSIATPFIRCQLLFGKGETIGFTFLSMVLYFVRTPIVFCSSIIYPSSSMMVTLNVQELEELELELEALQLFLIIKN